MSLSRFSSVALALLAGSAVALAASASTPTTAKATHTHHTVSGTIESFDVAGHQVKLKTAKSEMQFDVAAAKVWSGSKSVELASLSNDIGAHATVTYEQKDGQMQASSVRIKPAHVAAHTSPKK